MMPAASVPMKVKVHQSELNLNEERYRPVIEYLEKDNFRPKDFREYLAAENTNPSFLFEVILVLAHAGHIVPCQSENAVKQVKRACERLNVHICERAEFSGDIAFLASPLTGCGVEVSRFNQIFLAQYKSGLKSADKLAAAAWKIMSRNGKRMVVEDKQKLSNENGEFTRPRKVLETPEENVAHLKTLAEKFLERLPVMKALMLA